jgi:hypothetical protein
VLPNERNLLGFAVLEMEDQNINAVSCGWPRWVCGFLAGAPKSAREARALPMKEVDYEE